MAEVIHEAGTPENSHLHEAYIDLKFILLPLRRLATKQKCSTTRLSFDNAVA